MVNDKLDRLVERMTQQQSPSDDNALTVWARMRKSNLERLGTLKDALESAITCIQNSGKAVHWNDVAVRFLNEDTVLVEKADNPYIHCALKLTEDNTCIQGTVRAARRLPDPDAVVEASIRIGLTNKNGKPSYSLNGKTFSSVDSLSPEILGKIQDTVNQDPAVVRAVAAKQSLDAEMKRGEKAMNAVWNRNLKARQKRDARADKRRDAKAGRWP